MVAPVLAPLPGETQSQFFDRAMSALKATIPSVNRRTLEVIRLWKMSPNDADLRDKARLQFPEGNYQSAGTRCVFLEHTVPAAEDGSRPAINYNRGALEKLVNWANYRIRNADMFSAISDGHTPTPEEASAGKQQPDVLGYAGPFYIGLLGDVDPQWAIYADEYVHADDVPKFAKLQRRSPEVWVNEPIDRRTLDPIAALGSATPRLDCGMNPYSRASDGRVVMRYSAGSLPGPMNTFVPGSGTKSKKNSYGAHEMINGMRPAHRNTAVGRPTEYAAEQDPMNPNTLGADPNDPSQLDQGDANGVAQGPDIQALIMNALQDLLPSILENVQQQLGGNEGTNGDQLPGANSEGVGDTSITGASPEGDGFPRGMEPAPKPAPEPQPTAVQPAPAESPMDDGEKRQYSAMSGDCKAAYMAGRKKGCSMTQNYSRNSGDLHAVVARQQVQIQRLQSEMAQRDRDAMRYSKLSELSKDFSFDIDDEMQTVLDMSDTQFDRHCQKTVAKYQKRGDITNVEFFDDATLNPEQGPMQYSRNGGRATSPAAAKQIEQYSRQAAQTAVEKNAKQRGSTTFEAEFNALLKQHGIAV